MRIRLLVDTELDQADILRLQELTDSQPVGTLQIEELGLLGVRLIGALPIPEE